MTTIARDSTLQLRISTEDKDRIRDAAAQSGLDLSSFVLMHAKAAADAVLAENSRLELSDEGFQEFLEALDAPARALPGLAALLNKPSPFSDR